MLKIGVVFDLITNLVIFNQHILNKIKVIIIDITLKIFESANFLFIFIFW